MKNSRSTGEPHLHITFSRPAFRAGETVIAIIDVENNQQAAAASSKDLHAIRQAKHSSARSDNPAAYGVGVIVERLTVELKGIERLDPSWIALSQVATEGRSLRGSTKGEPHA